MTITLEAGTEAETCFMAGRDMNGLRGIIVCFNSNNGRYTLELDNGDMMSLRPRNVRSVTTTTIPSSPSSSSSSSSNNYKKKKNTSEEEKEEEENPGTPSAPPFEPQDQDYPSQDFYDAMKSNNKSRTFKKKKYDKKSTSTTSTTTTTTNNNSYGNILDTFLSGLYSTFSNMSPSIVLISIIAGYWFLNSSSSSYPSYDSSSYRGNNDSYNNSNDKWHHNSRNRYRHQQHSYSDWNYGGSGFGGLLGGGLGGLGGGFGCFSSFHNNLVYGGGILSIGALALITYQAGTQRGRTKFTWTNVQNRILQLNIWEIMRLVTLLERVVITLYQFLGNNHRRRR